MEGTEMATRKKTAQASNAKSSTSATTSKTKRVKGARRRYSDAERRKILDTAKSEGLTGAQVRDRFGVSTLTYYTWRKKAATSRGRKRGRPARDNFGDFSGQLREAVRAKVREMLPEIIEQEIGASLGGRKQ
jgi:transposase-like protein